ncbi:MAG TPA: hypothetical protein VL947_06820 [Cytophagales bacterium]|nr:hypothetical protein [Cytophagales bacterium]
MKQILFLLTTLACFISCKKKEAEKTPERISSVTVNGTLWASDHTTPPPSGSYATLYYYKNTQKLTLSIINTDTGEKIILLLKAPTNITNTTYNFDGKDYTASFYLADESRLMNKVVTGSVLIRQLSFSGENIDRFDADFNFQQTSEDLEGNPFNHKIENASVRNLKGTI